VTWLPAMAITTTTAAAAMAPTTKPPNTPHRRIIRKSNKTGEVGEGAWEYGNGGTPTTS